MTASAADRAAQLSRDLTAQLARARGGTPAPASASASAEQHGPRVVLAPDSGTAGADARQRAHAADLARRLTERTATSKELAQRRRSVLADSRAVVGFRRATKETLYPLSARSARGAQLTDIDGNTYTDITMGFGALLLGHEPECVTEAVRAHLDGGLRFGPRPVEAGEVAELLAGLTGMERVAFANSGTEANSGAIRLARAATGRDRVVMFRGSYHGHIDPVLGRPGPDGGRAVPVSRGIPASAVADLLVLEYGSQEALDTIDALGDSIATVVVEPVQCRNPGLRPVEFLRSLRELTRRRGIVLLFDEMLTGLRPHPRGAQHHFGVVPDLATYGKALGSGFPVGAIAGRADLLDGVDGGFWRYGDDSAPGTETTFFGGTYLQHPLSMAAAKAVLTHLVAEGPALQERLNARTDALADDLNTFFRDEEFPLEVAHFGSMFRFTHRADMELLYRHLLLRGIYVWEWRSFYLSTAHTDADVERVADAVKGSLREMREGGFFPATRPKSPPKPQHRRPAPDFGVYFFGDYPDAEDTSQAYDRIVETARFADTHGFSSLWIPERHFHSFGGLFPNPAVLAAALARETERIRLNAGSVVLPLHDPVRVAEEWAVVDRLSGGRVGLGCATGWHARDFVLHPDRFERRTEIAFEHLDAVRELWRGGTLLRESGDGRPSDVSTLPRPVQEAPPMFLATSGRRASYEEAARRDLGIVTNLMNQSVAELAANIAHYRAARARHGLDPDAGRVTVLLHTYLADDHATARERAREPMTRYLRSSLQMRSAAGAVASGERDVAEASEADLEYLFLRAYDRYCDERALIGTPETCAPVVAALRAAGVDEIAALVDFGMPGDLARAGLDRLAALREATAAQDVTPAADVTAPATAAQRRLWLAAQLAGDPAAYNEVQAVRLRGPLDVPALTAAVDGLVARHAGLRTVFRAGGDDGLLQQIVRASTRVPLAVTDARDQDPDAAIEAALRAASTRAFDLADGPLCAPRLLTLADDDHVLLLGLHHLITDGHSARLLADDLQELYTAHVQGRAPHFPEPAGTTVDATEQATDDGDLEWWLKDLDPMPPVLAPPTDRPRGRRVSGLGGAAETGLDAARTAAVQEWSGRRGVTLFATLLTAWQLVLRERTGLDEFVIGSTFARRTPATARTVGFHAAVLPLRAALGDGTTVTDAVRATRDTLFEAERHQHVDPDELAARLGQGAGRPRPLVTVSADLDAAPLTRVELPGLTASDVPGGASSAPLELALMAVRTPSGLRLRIRYDAGLFDDKTVRGLLADLDRVLRAMVEDAAETVRDTRPVPSGAGDELRAVWRAVLDVEDVADDADFFDLGGDSIAAIRLVNRVREVLGAEIALADFFAEPTPEAMARQIKGGEAEPVSPEPGPGVVDRAPVSPQQDRMIAGHHAVPRAEVWNVPTRIRFRGALDPDALRTALARLVERHHALRTRFVRGADGAWRQEVVDAPPPRLRIDDFSRLAPGTARERADAVCRRMAAKPFDLAEPTFPRSRLLKVADDSWVLMFVLHHISADGWSHSVLMAELAELYTAAAAGRPHTLPAPSAQAPEYAREQLGAHDPAEEERRAAFCARYLEGVPCHLDTPTDRPRPDTLSGAGGTVRGTVPAEVRTALEDLATSVRQTPFAVAAAALGVHLARLSGQRDVLLAVPYANRAGTAGDSLVAMVSTSVMVRVRIEPGEPFAELVARTGAEALTVMAHVLPTARIMRAMRDAGATEVPDRVPNVLAFQNYPDTDIEIPGLDVEVEDLAPPVARAELVFGLSPRRDPALGLRTFLEYSADLWDAPTADELLTSYAVLLGELCTHPGRPLAALLDHPHPLPLEAEAE
ncbi:MULTISPECIES: MupA/Atu3671 family FMN-dependent luciferase-like monooxygenase [unclassified Streptomyces]|uniref:MupA/Atu3671 family FMN-dependent luciferase-like monooxygenase n=1 Tax=unclassified Streptomyces TaxID=2593676 RepID=UPI000DBA14C8|nr:MULTISPECIES: MupA/Atu3671 family FMN-dependent luciferase-like monooxygenase [unclassified Streptomyces]MYT74071.1 LLM class flavin-dependent oxidoreductase [Streptomyces sp. SID8367]RAJ89488.1 natural product biosynthesis luciferase-like monooxygenase protein [Streptomyces sp. PsTaAH-137]